MEVKGKRVIVTGAALGIGKAMTKSFLESGAEVFIVDINEEALKQTASDLDVKYITADVSSESAVKDIISASNSSMGGIDIFCSNAGIGGESGLLNTTEEDWLNIWGVNVMSHIYAAKHTLPQMLEQGSGYFVNTASAAGLLTQIGAAGY